jgi:hypothetical protein
VARVRSFSASRQLRSTVFTGASSETTPSCASRSASTAVASLEMEPAEKSVAGVTGAPAVVSASP